MVGHLRKNCVQLFNSPYLDVYNSVSRIRLSPISHYVRFPLLLDFLRIVGRYSPISIAILRTSGRLELLASAHQQINNGRPECCNQQLIVSKQLHLLVVQRILGLNRSTTVDRNNSCHIASSTVGNYWWASQAVILTPLSLFVAYRVLVVGRSVS